MHKHTELAAGEAFDAATAIAAPDDDILDWGAEAIGLPHNLNERQTFHLLKTGAIPGRKVGGKWVASRKRVRAAILGE